MKDVYLVTGAAGHLGGTVTRLLCEKGQEVRALVLPGDAAAGRLPKEARLFYGDVTRPETLRDAFTLAPGEALTVIHAAGIVSIASHFDERVFAVNVGGTRNIVDACVEFHAKKLVHVSSVHALPPLPCGQTITEIDRFDPEAVKGLYARTKAEATQYVLEAARTRGLNACVVHPSGILGPGDCGRGHITQLLIDFCNGSLTAGVHGGYDFVDVRDVAGGILAACKKGRAGECYLLTNRYFTVPELLDIFARVTGHRPVLTYLPLWVARATAPLAEAWYALKKEPPLYTRYSLYTLSSNAQFSHAKADRELGYTVRPMAQTAADAAAFLTAEGRIRPTVKKTAKRRKKGASALHRPEKA